MKDRAQELRQSASRRARAEAAAWIAKLYGPERSAVLERAWRDWVTETPDHACAWEVASDTWISSHHVSPQPTHPLHATRRIVFRPRAMAMAFTVVLCAVGVEGTLHFFGVSPVYTGVGEQRILNLEDGTRVELNTNSSVVLHYDEHTRRVVLASGEAYFSVAHERRPFVVLAGARKIIATGTSFVVRRDERKEDAVTVTLIEGRVAVAPETASDVLPAEPLPEITVLSSGQRLRVRRHAQAIVDAPSIDRATGWLRGQVVFDHATLADAAAELNRYSKLPIRVAPALSTLVVGGVFRIGDSESFAHAVAESHDLQVINTRGELILQPRPDTTADSQQNHN